MDNLDFVIPTNKLELLDSCSGSYYIEEVIPYKEVDGALKNAKNAMKSEGPHYIVEHFPVYYAILTHSDKLHNDIFSKALYDLTLAIKQMSNNLDLLLEDSEIDPEVAQKNLKVLKMLTYAYTNIVIQLENILRRKQKDQLLMPGKKSRKPTKSDLSNDEGLNKMETLSNLAVILRKQICKLWDPPICEESFINIIAEVLYTFMQDPGIKTDSDLQSAIFHILGELLKNYNYSLTFMVRIVQLVKAKENEHLPSFVPQGIKTLVEDYNCKSLVKELVRELTEWQADESIQDAPGTKHCSNILVDMTVLMPELMIPEVIYLIRYLNHESHTLRVCVLTIITEVIINVLGKEDMSDEEKETREYLFKQLYMHIHDHNAHVRSKVLNLWAKLQYDGVIPLCKLPEVLERASNRLADKAVLVRKCAVNLMTKFIESNPFSATLNLDAIEKDLQNEKTKLEELRKKAGGQALTQIQEKEQQWAKIEDDVRKVIANNITQATQQEKKDISQMKSEDLDYIVRMYLEDGKYEDAFAVCHAFEGKIEGMKESRKDFTLEEQIEFYVTILHGVYSDIKKNAVVLLNEEIRALSSIDMALQADIDATEKNIAYLQDVVNFLTILDAAMPRLIDLLESATLSDVTETIEYFIVAYQFQLKGSLHGLEVMLELIKAGDKERKNAVANAYKRLFLENAEKKNSKEFAEQLVKGLINVLKTVNLSSLPHFGTIVSEWVNNGLLNNAVIEYLWNMFTGNIPDLSAEDTRSALQLLTFVGSGRISIIEKNMKLVAELAFKEKGMADVDLVITACQMLSLIGQKATKVEDENPPARVPLEDPMWENLLQIMLHNFKINNSGTSDLMRAAIDLVYKICRSPDQVCEKLIRMLHPILKKEEKVDNVKLTCFIYVLGEIAIKQFVYLDTSVYKELKRRNFLREKKEKKDKKNKNTRVDLNSTRQSASMRNPPENAEESFLEGAQADDTDSEFILRVCETEIVNTNLLGHFVPIIQCVLKKPEEYNSEELQTAAALTMMRYMLISDTFCKKHIRFMITVLERTQYTGVKNNIIISVADLLHRFPNTIEPWSNHLYKCVRDPSLDVRLTAVSITTSLLLQHVLRVKGNIAELALCINDDSQNIVYIVTSFFYSLSQQTPNPIYNILPDIISNLSNESQQIDEETFRKVMKFLIKHIDKDKQIEPLVEKLCARISATVSERHLRDVSYCLTILNHNDKSIQKLVDSYPSYKLKLEDEEVLELFISIVDKHKNAQKEEMKVAVKKLDELLRTGKTTDENKENTGPNQPKKKPARKRQKRLRSS